VHPPAPQDSPGRKLLRRFSPSTRADYRPDEREESESGLPDATGAGDWTRATADSVVWGWRNRRRFGQVGTFAFFLGYPRSGHSLVGSLLNAHRDAVISHELDALRYVQNGFRRTQLFGLILHRDQQFASIGRRWSGYEYEVPGQFQGRVERLAVIGDKRGGMSTLRLGTRPELLERLRRVVRVPVRAVHVIRNPYDNIATLAKRDGTSIGEATRTYVNLSLKLQTARPAFAPGELLELRYEDFVAAPADTLARICTFVGLDPEPSYLEACAGVVWPSSSRSRDAAPWTDEDLRRVERRVVRRFAELDGYRFDD
jgi:hypothetical protein